MNEQEFVKANGNAWKELESELKLFRRYLKSKTLTNTESTGLSRFTTRRPTIWHTQGHILRMCHNQLP